MDYTRLTNLEVMGDLKIDGDTTLGLTASSYTVTATDATAAAGSAPTKAEFDAVVTLANEIKADLNALVAKIAKS